MLLQIKSCSLACAVAFLLLAAFPGCDKKEEKPAVQSPAVSLPATLLLTSPPTQAPIDIAQAIANAKDGEKILVTGVVGGRKEPFVPNRSAVLIIDKSVPDCIAEGDECKTPWDYCCTPKEKLKGHVALVQVVDAAGQPFKTGLDKTGQIAPLKTLLVQGTVQRDKDSGTLTINATGIYVQP